MNATRLRLLRDVLGMEVRLRRIRRYAAWTEEDAREFDAALLAQRRGGDDARESSR